MMGERGVSRPMAEQELKSQHKDHDSQEQDADGHDSGGEHGGEGDHSGHEMSQEDRREMLTMHHRQTLWVYWTLPVLGCWMVLAPFMFGYLNPELWVNPSGGRGVWFSSEPMPGLRAQLMTWSDVISGVLLLIFGWRALTPNRPVSLWLCCGVGVWLTVAPVLFWAPTAASYLNDTAIGMLLIALTILIPGMPNMIMYMQHGPATPPGWSYNPSSWPQRWIMIATGFLGFVVSRYLTMFQLGYIDRVWDPFFGFQGGTEKVLNSKMSHMWPISDAGLGAVSYTLEFLMGYMGSPSRWRTMPWMVTLFGVLVIPLGLTHIILVISQPLLVHAWCSGCLLAALIMLPMIPLEVDEVVAMGQHMRQASQRGDRGGSLWKIFWMGGTAEGCTADERSPELMSLPQQLKTVFLASVWGMTATWPLIVSSIVGVVLMFCPTLLGLEITSRAADIGHLGGALIVTMAVICMGEVIRAGRYLNVLIGLAVAGGGWLVDDGSVMVSLVYSLLGLAVAVLAVPLGRVREQYGKWDSLIR